jgi:hypothetical protein
MLKRKLPFNWLSMSLHNSQHSEVVGDVQEVEEWPLLMVEEQ